MRTETLCRTCRFLSGCSLLESEDKVFDWSQLSTDEAPKECERWEPAGYREVVMRLSVLEKFGIGALEAVHTLPRPEITEQEGTVAVDFLKMAGDGVTHNERAAQLRYMTDDEGELLLDDAGEKIPRLSYDLRKYATDPNGPVQAKETVVLFWTPAQLVAEILKAEKEAGIIVSPQEKKKLTQGGGSTQKKEEKDMPRMNIKKAGIGGGGGGGKRFGFPATSKKVDQPEDDGAADEPQDSEENTRNGVSKPKVRAKSGGNGKSTPSKAEPTTAGLSAEQLAEAFTPLMVEIAEEAAKKAVEAYIQTADKQEAVLNAVKENQDVLIGAITILHDVLAPGVTGDDERTLIDKGADILAYMEPEEGNGD